MDPTIVKAGIISGHIISANFDTNWIDTNKLEYWVSRSLSQPYRDTYEMEAEEEPATNTYVIRPNFKHKCDYFSILCVV